MRSDGTTNGGGGTQITLDLPAKDGDLFGSQAVHDTLTFLSRYHTDEFSIRELADATGYSRRSISTAIDVLTQNDLAKDRRKGTKRLTHVNQARLSRPDDPILQIPQSEFHTPVRTATDALVEQLNDVIAVLLYGSVARGEADRRSDIDIWVLVADDRGTNQRTANQLRQDLEARQFQTGRYIYEIDVEGLHNVPQYLDDIQKILSDGIVLYSSEKFDTVRTMVFHE